MIELPAISGDDALGFLAAMGLMALGEQEAIPPLRLSWTLDASPMALVSDPDERITSREQLADALDDAFRRFRDEGRALPGVDASFPVARSGSGTDPMRMTPEAMAEHFEWADRAWLDAGDRWPARWLLALCGQTATRDGDRGDVFLTPFYAPTGQMTLRGSVFEASASAVDGIGGPADALTAWRRTSYDGANFDERAKQDAGVTTWGQADNQGAPSPTWLAAMGLRMFPNVETPRGLETVGWQRVRLYPGYTRRSLIWPTWHTALGAAAVRTLIAHPDLDVRQDGPSASMRQPGKLERLGVVSVFGASRRTSTQGDGPLGPTVRIWP